MLLCAVVLPRFTSRLIGPSLGLSLFATAACHYPKPPAAWTGEHAAPVAPPPPLATAPAPVAAPPPPPKCEDLAESCTAGPGTKLLVGASGAWFTPPEG